MDAVITLVAPSGADLDRALVTGFASNLQHTASPVWLCAKRAVDLAVKIHDGNLTGLRAEIAAGLSGQPIDFAVQPAQGRTKALFMADMDSTMIGQECVDEMGVAAGLGDRIAHITERAMRGELEFEAAMDARVGLLEGLPEALLTQIFEEQITFNPGARTLVQTLRAHGVTTCLVSGGFTHFTSPVAKALGFEHTVANRLEIAQGKLSGRVIPPILGGRSKLESLVRFSRNLGVPAAAAMAVGDGANDVEMISAAGLGVAYRAKPILAETADARVDHTDLTTLLFFQGYSADQFSVR